jgi:hypothetical protein
VYKGTLVKNGQSSAVAIKTLREDQINGKDEIDIDDTRKISLQSYPKLFLIILKL